MVPPQPGNLGIRIEIFGYLSERVEPGRRNLIVRERLPRVGDRAFRCERIVDRPPRHVQELAGEIPLPHGG